MYRLLLILFFLLKSFFCSSQYLPAAGTIPYKYTFKQINTDTVRVVFPAGLQNQAMRIANTVHLLAGKYNKSIGDITKKINIFLINTTSVSNGFVRPMPYHSKFFTMAPQYPFAGTVDWLDLLTIHEYRHVMQFNNSLHGITKYARIASGDGGWGLMMVLSIPSWFFEGDAVVQETALSYSGRGRLPSFKNRFNMIMDMDKPFGYEKMRCGSYRDYIPNIYSLGYQMVRYGRRNFGNDIFKKTIIDAAKYKGVLWPFSKALKKYTGYSTSGLYKQIVAHHHRSNHGNTHIDYLFSTPANDKNPTFFYNPKFISENKIIALKSSFAVEPYLVSIDLNTGKEKKLFPVGSYFGEFDADKDFVVYSEIIKNPRWAYISKSDIFLYDIAKGSTTKITSRYNCFSPVISPDAKNIAAFSATDDMKYFISLFDLQTGKTVKKLSNSENYFFSFLDWYDENTLVAVARKDNMNSVVSIDINTGDIDILIPFMYSTIKYLTVKDNKLVFSNNALGSDEVETLFYYDVDSRKLFTTKDTPRYAYIMPSVNDKGKMVFCEKIFNNTVLRVGDFDSIFDNKELVLRQEFYDNMVDVIKNEGGPIVHNIPDRHFAVEDYSAFKHSIRLHSWLPAYYNNKSSILFLSNDDLDRLSIDFRPEYDYDNSTLFLSTNVNYAGFYPVYTFGSTMGFHIRGSHEIQGDTIEQYTTGYSDIYTSVGLPLNYTKHNWTAQLRPSMTFKIKKYFNTSVKDVLNQDYNYNLDFALRFSVLRKRAYRDFYPKWGFKTSLDLKDLNTGYIAGNTLMQSLVYLPGLFDNHSFRLSISVLEQSDDISTLYLSYPYARGYKRDIRDSDISGIKLGYSLPLSYPDMALGKYIFMKRIRTNIYFDMDKFSTAGGVLYRRSVGMELIFDNVYFRLGELPLGVGFDYLLDAPQDNTSKINIRFILGL